MLRFLARAAIELIAALITTSALVVPGGAQTSAPPASPATSPSQAVGRIRGTVFDSLLMQPVSGASVTLMSSGRTTVTDADGRFGFDSVKLGAQPVAFSSAAIDSLGLGTLGAIATVNGTETATITLSTPSLRTMWSLRCGGSSAIGSDSGIVWGTVHDALTDAAADTAGARFYWYDLSVKPVPGLKISQRTRTVATDPTGVYFACGLPSDVVVSTEGVSNNSASGRVELLIGSRHLKRVDLLVSTDMVLPGGLSRTATDSALKLRVRGRATLSGLVHDAKGAPIANANVMVVASDTSARTDASGRFQLAGLPSGTQQMQVRQVGVSAVLRTVQLRAGKVTDVDVELSRVTTLAASRTVAKSARRLEYEDRRDRKIGYAVDTTVLNHRSDIYSALLNMPLTRIVHDKNGTTSVRVRKLTTKGYSDPAIYLDGLRTTLDAVQLLPPDHFRAIEFLPAENVPGQYGAALGEGVLLFWSRNVKW